MARIKITQQTIKAKLQKWAQNQEIMDELIYYQNEINDEDVKNMAWNIANMIVSVEPDVVSGFKKIVWKEKL